MELDKESKNYHNSQDIEIAWAMKAFEHAETYFNLITSLDCSDLRFTDHDDEIYKWFKTEIKDLKLSSGGRAGAKRLAAVLTHVRIDVLDAVELKSEASKSLWRPFCESFKGRLDEYNFGTLLRIDCTKDLSDENTILVPRIQFWAIEISRNRDGLNKNLLHRPKKS